VFRHRLPKIPLRTPLSLFDSLSIDQAIDCAGRGAPLFVVGAPLVIGGASFRPADGNLHDKLKQICDAVHQVR
jgi:hypothetical protein